MGGTAGLSQTVDHSDATVPTDEDYDHDHDDDLLMAGPVMHPWIWGA
jgi:hypothetical protein